MKKKWMFILRVVASNEGGSPSGGGGSQVPARARQIIGPRARCWEIKGRSQVLVRVCVVGGVSRAGSTRVQRAATVQPHVMMTPERAQAVTARSAMEAAVTSRASRVRVRRADSCVQDVQEAENVNSAIN